ncbi:hypothetical protein ACQ4PT_035309 [Festuca glaucescens]
MIPIMGVKFHVSKMSADQVRLFRMAERQQAEEMLDDYIHRCSEIKVKCEKLVIENEDVASGLVELIRLHGTTKLVIAAAADKHYSKKLNRPVSKIATEMMQRADPSCKIWFVCKEKLICTRDKEVQIAPPAVAAPLLPTVGQEVPRLPFHQKEVHQSHLLICFQCCLYEERQDSPYAVSSFSRMLLRWKWGSTMNSRRHAKQWRN